MIRIPSQFIFFLFIIIVVSSCKNDDDLTDIDYNPIPYTLEIPAHFPTLEIPSDNPMTVEGVQLGRRLFYDPILSADNTMSCSSCHKLEHNFTDGNSTSEGIDGIAGRRSAMSLENIAFFYNGLAWDGKHMTLEEQALEPVTNEIELHNTWGNVIEDLKNHDDYPTRFRKAFGIESIDDITKELAAKAIAQFERIIISNGNSKYDQIESGSIFPSDAEFNGFDMYFDLSIDTPDAECSHCHGGVLLTTNEYINNGLDEAIDLTSFNDLGRGEVTGYLFDNGKFRVPSLRNIALTAPYMHDGRFQTLEEVIDHYNSGGHYAENRDPLIQPLGLTEQNKSDLITFLHTLTDTTYLSNPDLSNPFE